MKLLIFLGLLVFASGFEPQCSEDEWFKCKDGLCVTKEWRCDGEPDCVDGSDEEECPEKKDQVDMIQSRSDSGEERLPKLESNVDPIFKPCDNKTEFQCNKTVLCVPKYWLCDGVNDCTDRSDEEPEMCLKYKSELHCENEMFFCNDTAKSCIPERWQCDGKDDCPNGYDENPKICNTTMEIEDCSNGYQCKSSENSENDICLSWDLVCNNKADCPQGDDEGNSCFESCKNVDCKGPNQSCRGRPDGQGVCVCGNGYRMLNDSTCVDINECQFGVPPCSQKCENGVGSYFCSCDFGYHLDKDGNCKANGANPATLYFSGVTEIRSREIPGSGHYNLITNDQSKVRQAIGVAFDTSEQRIYWADVSHKVIVSSNLAGGDFRTWNHSNIVKPEFLAIDWIGRNFYYSDSVKKIIGVCTIDGHYCQAVIKSGVTNPRGVAVQPDHGLLAYSNWDDKIENHPHIGLAGMDGTDLKILVNTTIRWPNGLAFDMPSHRVFWGEAYYDLLESIRLDGTHRISVKPSTNFMSLHPFSVAVFEDTIYWSDYGLRDIQSCHKFTGENHKVVVKSARLQTYGIQIVHELLEPAKFSPCNSLRCGHMCLLKKGAEKAVCRCAEEFKLVNGHECVPEISDFMIPFLPTSKPINIFHRGMIYSGTKATEISTEATVTTPKPTTVADIESNTIVIATTQNTNSSGLHVHKSPVKSSEKDNTVEVVIGTIVAILAFIALVLCLYCCWGKHRKMGQVTLASKSSQVFFKNPSFGLDNNLKENPKSEEELQSVQVMAAGKSGREIHNYYSYAEDDLDFNPTKSRPVSSLTINSSSQSSDLMVDAMGEDSDHDKCQLIN